MKPLHVINPADYREYWIDGHNLIGAWPGLELGKRKDRERLLQRLHTLGLPMIVAFDTGRNNPHFHSYKRGLLEIIFPPDGWSADDILVRLAQTRNTAGVLTVTSDRLLGKRLGRLGVKSCSCQVFINTFFSQQEDT